MIDRLEADIHENVDAICAKILARSGTSEAVDVSMAYSCFTSDTISSYSFGTPFGLIAQPTWTPNFRQATLAVLKPVFIFRFFPIMGHLAKMGE